MNPPPLYPCTLCGGSGAVPATTPLPDAASHGLAGPVPSGTMPCPLCALPATVPSPEDPAKERAALRRWVADVQAETRRRAARELQHAGELPTRTAGDRLRRAAVILHADHAREHGHPYALGLAAEAFESALAAASPAVQSVPTRRPTGEA